MSLTLQVYRDFAFGTVDNPRLNDAYSALRDNIVTGPGWAWLGPPQPHRRSDSGGVRAGLRVNRSVTSVSVACHGAGPSRSTCCHNPEARSSTLGPAQTPLRRDRVSVPGVDHH